MREVRVIGRDTATGKLYVCLHGEVNKKRWTWLPLEHPYINDTPDIEGDMIIPLVHGIDNAPISPPDEANFMGKILKG
jgi:hypothetical protein